jgi:hypothetical protein
MKVRQLLFGGTLCSLTEIIKRLNSTYSGTYDNNMCLTKVLKYFKLLNYIKYFLTNSKNFIFKTF